MRILGFSPDGKRFAFEQSGSRDGSNHPYARITIIGSGGGDVERVVPEDNAPVSAAREAVSAAANPLLDRAGGVNDPFVRLAADDAARAGDELLPMEIFDILRAAARSLDLSHPALGGAARLVLSERPSERESCRAHPATVVAEVALVGPDGKKTRLFDEAGLPDDFLCPRAYGLVGAYLHDRAGARALAVVIAVFPLGFEEPDRRFVAALLPLAD